MDITEDKSKLLTTDSDGFLTVYDIRANSDANSDSNMTTMGSAANSSDSFKPSLYAMSDNQEDEQTGVLIVKNGKKVVTSSQEGVISLWNWDWFGD